MKLEQIHSVQNWLPFEKILEKGIVKLKDNSYIKILNISPINYILKSDLEKEAILNSYNNIFKNCNFNMQILVQSKKIDLSNHIKKIKSNSFQQNLKEKYIDYINKKIIKQKILFNNKKSKRRTRRISNFTKFARELHKSQRFIFKMWKLGI